jgi:hypothetical protein
MSVVTVVTVVCRLLVVQGMAAYVRAPTALQTDARGC